MSAKTGFSPLFHTVRLAWREVASAKEARAGYTRPALSFAYPTCSTKEADVRAEQDEEEEGYTAGYAAEEHGEVFLSNRQLCIGALCTSPTVFLRPSGLIRRRR